MSEHLAASERAARPRGVASSRACEMCGAPVSLPLVYCPACIDYIRDCEAEAGSDQ